MPSIDKLRHNIRHAVSLSAFSPNLIHRIRYFFSLYSYFPRLLYRIEVNPPCNMVIPVFYITMLRQFLQCKKRTASPILHTIF